MRSVATLPAARPQSQGALITCKWLVGPRYDLGFFIGSCVVTWLFLGLYMALTGGDGQVGQNVLVVYFLYTALFDHPHIFQTFSRTHADPDERRIRGRQHSLTLAAFVALGFLFAAFNLDSELVVIAAIWGSFHIVRQHWGILRAYQVVNGDNERVDRVLDALVFYGGMLAFLLYDYTGNEPETLVFGELTAAFPSVPEVIADVVWYVFWGIAAIYVGRQLQRLITRRPINVPKLLLLVSALGTHGLVFCFTATPFLVAEALETSYHNVQYQGWIMHYQRQRFGWRALRRWLLVALGYGLIVGGLEVASLLHRDISWLFVPFAMAVLYHYYVDGQIWKLGADRSLRRLVLGG